MTEKIVRAAIEIEEHLYGYLDDNCDERLEQDSRREGVRIGLGRGKASNCVVVNSLGSSERMGSF